MKNFINKALPACAELVARFIIGVVFIESGWGKFHDLGNVVDFFESLGIPFARTQAPFVAATELVGGIFIICGLFTRWVSWPLIAIMCVAIRTAKWEEIEGLSTVLDLPEFLYIAILLWLAAYGAQFISLDALLQKFRKQR